MRDPGSPSVMVPPPMPADDDPGARATRSAGMTGKGSERTRGKRVPPAGEANALGRDNGCGFSTIYTKRV